MGNVTDELAYALRDLINAADSYGMPVDHPVINDALAVLSAYEQARPIPLGGGAAIYDALTGSPLGLKDERGLMPICMSLTRGLMRSQTDRLIVVRSHACCIPSRRHRHSRPTFYAFSPATETRCIATIPKRQSRSHRGSAQHWPPRLCRLVGSWCRWSRRLRC